MSPHCHHVQAVFARLRGLVCLFCLLPIAPVLCLPVPETRAEQEAQTRQTILAARSDNTLIPLQVALGVGLMQLAQEYCKRPQDWKTIARLHRLSPPYIIRADRDLMVPLGLLRLEALSLDVVLVNGRAWRQGPDGERTVLRSGERLLPGETVLTDEDTFVHLLFPNGLSTRMEPRSSLTLGYLIRLSDGEIKAEAHLTRGELTHTLDRTLRFNETMRTRAPAVMTGIRGTTYRLKVGDERNTRVETLEGEVLVRSGRKTRHLGPGKGLYAGLDHGLGPSGALPEPLELADLAELYRSLPARVGLPAREDVRRARLRLAADAEGRFTKGEVLAEAGESLVLRDVPDGSYFAFLTVTDDQNFESRETEGRPLTVRTVPPAPMLALTRTTSAAPRAFSIQRGRTARLDWLASDQAVAYRVQVARDADFQNIVEESRVERPFHTIQNLTSGRYYARIQAEAADGFLSEPSPAARWIQKTGRFGRRLKQSAGLTIRWADAPGSTGERWRYDFQAAADPDFGEPLVDVRELDHPVCVLPQDLAQGNWFVRARAVDASGRASAWTPVQHLTVDRASRPWPGH